MADFEETLLFVSHDRYFINRFANRIWELKDGKILDFRGTYEEYQKMLEQQKTTPAAVVKEVKEEKPKKRVSNTRAIEMRIREVEREIEKLESAKAAREEAIAEAASDFNALQELYAEQETDDAALNALYEEWETLQMSLE